MAQSDSHRTGPRRRAGRPARSADPAVPTDELELLASAARALGAAPRIRILLALERNPELAATDIAQAIETSLPTALHYLEALAEARLVTQRRAGRHRFYAL